MKHWQIRQEQVRRRGQVLQILQILVMLLLLWVGAVHAELLRLTQTQADITVNGQTTRQPLELPYNWDIQNRAQPGEGVFELRFELTEIPLEPWGIYMPSVGNAYEVWLNGTLLQHEGDMSLPNGADFSKLPRFLVISPSHFRPDNVLRVHIRADAERRGGLSEVRIGPAEEARAAYQRSYMWRGNGSLLVVAFSFAVGFLSLGLWLTQVDHFHVDGPRRAPLYLFAALAEFCWTLAVGDALIETPFLPWPWWSALPAAGAAAWACNLQLFCIEVAEWRNKPFVPWFRRWLMLLITLSAVLPLWAASGQQPIALIVWHTALAVTFLGFGFVFLRQAIGSSNQAHRLVAAALLINLGVGLWDLFNFRIFPSFPDNSLLRFSSLFFGLSLAVIVIARFSQANHEASRLLSIMSARIAEKEAELHASYSQLETQAREQERTAERSRILRDMHDGVGSHISMAIRQLHADRAAPELPEHKEVLHTLRDALDQLKLSIDAIHLPPGDITSLLANLRYRLEPRLAASGIELVWDVDVLQAVEGLDASAMRHLQFMLFEALSNVVQHAKAKSVRIEAHALRGESTDSSPSPALSGACVVVRVVDDGQGFDSQSLQRKGLVSMRERAAAIGAQLTIQSRPGQTQVEIRLS